jgi:hypothetical protein
MTEKQTAEKTAKELNSFLRGFLGKSYSIAKFINSPSERR